MFSDEKPKKEAKPKPAHPALWVLLADGRPMGVYTDQKVAKQTGSTLEGPKSKVKHVEVLLYKAETD